MRKYGEVNFEVETIEAGIDCLETLKMREIYWVSKYNSKKCGYNMTDGGDTNWFVGKTYEELYGVDVAKLKKSIFERL
jgi:hypothetical protein